MKTYKILFLVLILLLTSCSEKKQETTGEKEIFQEVEKQTEVEVKKNTLITKLGNTNYGKDSEYIYYGDKKIEMVDYETFKVFENDFAEDKDDIYYLGQKNEFKNIKKEEVDLSTLEQINQFNRGAWFKDKSNIYFKSYFEDELRKLDNIDLDTFEPLSMLYAKDKEKVFFKDKIVTYQKRSINNETGEKIMSEDKYEYADPETFEIKGGGWTTIPARDKNHIFVNGFMLENADLETFGSGGGHDFYKDKNRYYYMEYEIPGADLETFKVGGCGYYSKDKKNVYYKHKVVKGADPKTFGEITIPHMGFFDTDYGKDKNNCYREEKVVEMSKCTIILKEIKESRG